MSPTPKILRFQSKLLEIKDLTSSVKEFTFSTPDEFTFNAGQFASILFDANDKKYRRPYSIVSSPKEKKIIKFCIKEVTGGPGTTYLWSRKIGDIVSVIGPMGVFVVKDEHKNGDLFFISTGTGVAPFISIINTMLKDNFKHKITLICGYRHDLLYHNQLSELTKTFANFKYHPILSKPTSKDYKGEIGRIQQIIAREIPSASKGRFYLCGLYEMIEQSAKQLIEKKISTQQIHFERYD